MIRIELNDIVSIRCRVVRSCYRPRINVIEKKW
jgi:hypothetical protein